MYLLLAFLALPVYSILPGISQKKYKLNERIRLYAGPLTSSSTQLPFDYYYLPFCKQDSSQENFDNIGQALSGDLIEKTPYNIYMDSSQHCSQLCTQPIQGDQFKNFRWMIDQNYKTSWIVDSLPAGLRVIDYMEQKKLGIYENGFPIGFKNNGEYYIYNHHHIIIQTYKESNTTKTIVGFLVQPFSLNHKDWLLCDMWSFKNFFEFSQNFTEEKIYVDNEAKLAEWQSENYFMPQKLMGNITYSYSVSFEESNVRWASRWDNYLYKSEGRVHWISIINSFVMILLLSCVIGGLFRRAVSRDISVYNENDDLDIEVESGWKQLKGDVFRNPPHYSLFSIVIGTGVQLISMCFFTLVFACIGYLTPENRGALLTIMLLLFAMTGIVAGITSGRAYKMFSGVHWKRNALGTALLFPGITFCIFFTINLLILKEESSGAIPFLSLLELLMMWFGISTPLTFLGSALGYKNKSLISSLAISRIPKPLPLSQPRKLYSLQLLCSSLPFAAMAFELNSIMTSIWNHTTFYYLFGFLFLTLILVAIVSAEVSLLVVYIYLCKGDYRWWWISVIVPGASGVYLFIYCVFYSLTQLELTNFSSIVLYYGYMLIVSAMFAVITGAIGFLSSFFFVKKIYSLVKHD